MDHGDWELIERLITHALAQTIPTLSDDDILSAMWLRGALLYEREARETLLKDTP